MVDFLPKVKIELVVDDKKCKEAIEVIIKRANTGKIGDGEILYMKSKKLLEFARVKKVKTQFNFTDHATNKFLGVFHYG